MCLLLIALEQHPAYKLILAANRDEYYDRPTAPAQFWKENQELLAGRDWKAGGTWLGITRTGKLAALTNYRDPFHLKEQAPSRGDLVLHYLESAVPADRYLEALQKKGDQYNGFNLVLGTVNELFWYSNRGDGTLRLASGIHGVSNRLLNTPWPKVERAKKEMGRMLTTKTELDTEDLLKVLIDRWQPADNALPDTGVGLEWERILGTVFITSPVYGTRSSTVILVDHRDRVFFTERSYQENPGQFHDAQYHFHLTA
jgi:uncharacterized protein with NRDE domain